MLKNGFKLEVESLISKDISYVTETYVPERLAMRIGWTRRRNILQRRRDAEGQCRRLRKGKDAKISILVCSSRAIA